MGSTPGGPNEEKATVREVYRLVDSTRQELSAQIGDVRDELAGKVDGIADALAEVKDGLLPRVSTLEVQRIQDRTDIDDHDGRIAVLETAHNRALGHLTAWKIAGGVVSGAAAIVIADLIAKALGA